MGGMENTAGVRLHSHRHKLKQRFDIIRKLGQGTYGKVQLAVNKDTGQEVAIKTIKKAKIETEQDLVRIRREIQIMSSVQHPQIIHIYEVFENREKMVLVMEYAAGGELYDYLSERKVLSVDEARRVFRQVSSAVYYCHKHKICHRDLKLENILLDIDGNAKIADFGLSNVFDEKRRLDTFCGSPLYASPEIVKGVPYVGPEVDCWSLGVLLYTLVYGAMPFDGSNFRRLVKQITQGDFYEPPTPSTASPLVRAMLTVTAEKRANIADICNHWWVNDGEATSCLDEAETLANQTPVRLDLLLSLAPKHISSEHMLIQPDEEDASNRSDEGQSAAPHIQLPPPPPVPPPPNGPQAARSLSLGALAGSAAREIDFPAPAPAEGDPSTGAVPRRDDEKRRRESEARSSVETAKKRKDAADSRSSVKPMDSEVTGKAKLQDGVTEEKKKSKKKSREDLTVTPDKDKNERKKSTKKKEVISEGSPMDIDEREPKKAIKAREVSVENDVTETEKPDKRKSIRSRDSTSAAKEVEKKRTTKKKEPSEDHVEAEKSSIVSLEKSHEVPSRDSTPKAPSPLTDIIDATKKTNRTNSITTNASSDSRASSSIRSPINKSVISAISTDGTLKASDSSISTRHSPSPPKSMIETSAAAAANHVELKPPAKQPSISSATKSSQSEKLTKVSSAAKVPRTNSANKVYKASSGAKVTKNASAAKVEPTAVNGSVPAASDTDAILKETASKMKDEALPTKPESAETETTSSSPAKRKSSDALTAPATDSTSSKDSSVVSTPARSRTGSESSVEAKSGRQDSRRGSKIFSKAAMWDNMCSQQQNEKPPPAADKPRKTSRAGGLNLSDITKKFEEKPPAERKKPVVGSFKISDVKKSFENKSADKVGGFRRTSTDSSVDSKKEDSLPRSMKKEGSLPPPAKPVSKKVDVPVVKEKEIPIKKEETPPKEEKPVETSESKSKLAKEKSPVKSKVTGKSTVSSAAEIAKKEKSPVKEPTPKKEVPIKRDVTTPKRTSPVKEKPKAVTIAIKKTGTPHSETPPPKRDVETPDIERPRPADRKVKTTSSSNRAASPKFESSESSDSESEAERLLRQLSERRERIEAAKKEKLRKVSQQQEEARDTSSSSGHERISRPCNVNATTKDKSGLPPLETPSDTPDDMIPVKPTSIPKASMIKDAEQPSGAKFASLPRGFKSRGPEKSIKPQIQETDNQRRKKSEVAIVLTPSSQNLLQQRAAAGGVAPRDQDPSKRASYAEIQLAAPPGQQQEYKSEVRHSITPSSKPTPQQQQQHPHTPPHSNTAGDGVLQRVPRERIIPIMLEDQEEDDDRSATSDDREKWERSSNTSNISLARGAGGEPFLHGPLFKPAPRPGHMSPHLGGVFGSPSLGLSSSRGSVASSTGSSFDQNRVSGAAPTASPEPIRKSRRERIIPISFEGGDEGTPSSLLTPNTLDFNRPPSHQHHTNNSSSSSSHGMGRRLTIERPDSLSSNEDDDDEEEEEDEDDAFQILTAESLFSTLLNRVRNLTRKMSQEESRSRRLPLLHHGLGVGPGASPLAFHHHSSPFGGSGSGIHTPLRQDSSSLAGGAGSASAGVPTADNGGFWSSLYSTPREISRQNSEISSDGRGGERGQGSAGLGEIRIPLSRESSQDASLHHGEPGTPFNTLPRGWRTRLAGDDGSRPTTEGVPDTPSASTRGRGGGTGGGVESSGEASGRAGGISEQQKDQSVCAARLASSGDSLFSSVTGKKPTSVAGISLPKSPSVHAPSALTSKAPPGTGYKAFVSAKNVPASSTGKNVMAVPKRSSSTSAGNEAKVQLQKLVEELEISPDKQNGSTPMNSNPVISTQSSTTLNSTLKMTPVSLLSKPKSATSVPSVSVALSTAASATNAKSTKVEPTKTFGTQPSASAASRVISQQIMNQIPESVAKLNTTNDKTAKLSHASKSGNKLNTMIEKMPNSTSTVSSAGKTHSDIPVTVLALSPVESIMTQSLPPEKASSLLGTSKMNRSSVCIDNNIIQKTNGLHDTNQASISGRTGSTSTRTLTNGTLDTALVSNSVSTSSLLKTSDSNSSMRGSRTSLLIEPHKKLFPWDGSNQALNVNASSSTLNRQKSSLAATPYRRGRSEDLRPAIDSIGKIDSSFERYKKAAAAATSPSVEHTIKPYRGSRSRELNPTIEAASEKLSQLNSSNLKKISPFEAYRRSKSRDLGTTIEQLQKQQPNATSSKYVSSLGTDTKTRMTSPPPPGLPQSPTSIARLASPPPTCPKSLIPSPPTSLPVKPMSVQRSLPQNDKSPQTPFVKQSFSPEPQRSTTSSPALAFTKTEVSGPVNSSPNSPEPLSSLRNSPIIAPNEVTPKENQLNSVAQNNPVVVQRSKTPFERAKTKLERKIDRAKSPTFFVEHPKVSEEGTLDLATQNMLQNEINSGVVYDSGESEKTKEKEAIKKTSAGETDRPKSMYKMLTSKFNKSSNNMREETSDLVEPNPDEKFKLKRPSIFLKGKTEKSPSKTSIADVELQTEQMEKKPSKKLSDALNKFLGRKTDDSSKLITSQEEKRPSVIPSAATSDLAKSERDISKRPARYRSKVFSKSHENLNKYNEQGEIVGNRASSVALEDNCTIESVTKSLCDHLTQLENDITSRIGSMDSSSDLRSSKTNLGIKQIRSLAPTTSVQSLNSYGYSPALATRRQSQAVVTESSTSSNKPVISEMQNQTSRNKIATSSTMKETSTTLASVMSFNNHDLAHVPSNTTNNNVQRLKPEIAESVKSAPDEGRCFSPTSWAGDSVTSAPDDLQGVLSDDEEESVMDRITRKSFYSRFQDGKRRRSRISQPATKEDEDQQLAAAKARLMGDERRQRESLSPQRAMSPPFVSSRTSIGSSIPEWESAVARRSARRSTPRITSLPSNDYNTSVQKQSEDYNFIPSYREGSRERSSVARAAAAGAAAGYQAATDRGSSILRGTSNDPTDRGSLVLYNSVRDSSLSRLRSPSPPSKAIWSPPPHDVVVSTARDELSKRLTPLTRLASGRDSGNRVYRRTTTTGNLDLPLETTSTTPSRPAAYRRTTTSGNFELPLETSSSTLPRPTYRRTNTMDLPVTDSVISRPSDYRRLLQPANRRYSTASIDNLPAATSGTRSFGNRSAGGWHPTASSGAASGTTSVAAATSRPSVLTRLSTTRS